MTTRERLNDAAAGRILILDGAMGSLIQAWRSPEGQPLGEDDFRGSRFSGHKTPLLGCNDLLCLSRPDVISGIHEAYLEAGADIIETCSFNSTAVSLAGFGIGDLAYEVSAAAAGLARKAADRYSSAEKPRFVAGSMGPTAKSASITSDMDRPGSRAVTWDELEAAYYDNARGLIEGGADLLAVETVFDSLNAKAALFAINRLAVERGADIPVMVSATISESGRLLTGQRIESFCEAVIHAKPWAVGLNCSFGAEAIRPFAAELVACAPVLTVVYPNAGLPDRQGVYSETPEIMAGHIEACLKEGFLNIVGGCCGSTPAHIAAIAARAKDCRPRKPPVVSRAGAAAAGIPGADRAFQESVDAGNYEDAVETARDLAAQGVKGLSLKPGKAPDPAAFVRDFIFLGNCFPAVVELPLYIESSGWAVLETALKCLQTRSFVRYSGAPEESAEYREKARLIRAYGGEPVSASSWSL
ncbi:MAG: homocysteine S-methyltransferase family protein [Treponema sp.]|jgi:5-methyltetrahydrofolate--homocysteine methyltransferase|nr:homocysteine S-methyltransferase family protein [Treponema sp.]